MLGAVMGEQSQSDPKGNLSKVGLRSTTMLIGFRHKLEPSLLFKCHQLTVEHLLCAISHIISFNPRQSYGAGTIIIPALQRRQIQSRLATFSMSHSW